MIQNALICKCGLVLVGKFYKANVEGRESIFCEVVSIISLKASITAIPPLGIYPEKTIIQKESCTTMFIAALFTIARTWKQPKCPSTDEWLKKMWRIYTMEYYSAIKKKRN